MKLLYAKPSPFSRKVRIVISEKGLDDQITEKPINPFGSADELREINPLGKVPCLIQDDGALLYDSPVICEYLDHISDEPLLVPLDGPERWSILRRTALADGMLDAAVNLTMEFNRRGKAERSQTWIERWLDTITRGLDAVEKHASLQCEDISLADIGTACALGYLDFRHAKRIDWRADHPKCAFWFKSFSNRPSMQRTKH